VPVHVWNVLESCLNEALTNIGKHAHPTQITVALDATPHIVRLSIENDGVPVTEKKRSMGTGLRNIRHRLAGIGGTLAVAEDKAHVFHVVCVVPLKADDTALRN
jgi:signal transduction histidine kinase